MEYIGQHLNRNVYWLDYDKYTADELPAKDWVCLVMADSDPHVYSFEKFAETCIQRGVLEFKGQGHFGEKLHNLFDETIVVRQIIRKHRDITTYTTWHTTEPPAEVFWKCFYATRLPRLSDPDNVTIVCTDTSGINRREEFKRHLKKISEGWAPAVKAGSTPVR